MDNKLIELFKLVGKLKNLERTGWVTRIGIENPESVADHSFRCAFMAIVIGELKKVNTDKLIKMLLIHDIGESLIGDFDLFAKKKIGEKIWKEKENQAVHDILFNNLPEKTAQRYFDLWKEFEEQKTEEAKLAVQIDKLEVLIQAIEYEKAGYDAKKFDIFWRYSKPFVTDEDMKILLDNLEKERTKLS